MASWHAAAAAPAPARAPARKRPRTRDLDHKRARPAPRRRAKAKGGVAGGLAWIIVAGVLLIGIVALNVAVLRLNIRLDHMNNQSQQLQAENAALGAKLSAAAAGPWITGLAARKLGLQLADQSHTSYVEIAP